MKVFLFDYVDEDRMISRGYKIKWTPRSPALSTPLCRQCDIVDSNDHLLLTCIVFEQLRNNLRASLGIGALHYNWICTISTFNRRACSAVLHFLQSTNLF
ncbi:hypothetical protein AVEN_191171-1 [Araneus ventricosus]|uniref:Uncharacterized protein n=1 Tax=Araneus ventricosus TaxID=182803 RepID=A0A4Y2AXD9_ARAVE|nr:hypothetical protein AVEN_191171-1 [Araneus ventricosus]